MVKNEMKIYLRNLFCKTAEEVADLTETFRLNLVSEKCQNYTCHQAFLNALITSYFI